MLRLRFGGDGAAVMKRGRGAGASGYPQSERNRAHARAIAALGRSILAARPRCSATARHSGEPCRQPAKANGKCRFHGGSTPKGKGWHRITAPQPNAQDAGERFRRKLADVAKRQAKRRRKLAAMSPEERRRAELWAKTHAPGDPKRREAARERRRQAVRARKLIEAEQGAPAVTLEGAELAHAIETLRAEIAAAERRRAEDELEVFS